jgi:cupin 2 domain-containing protein
MKPSNLFEAIPANLPGEHFEPLAQGESFTLERIVSAGHATPADEWYDQERDEWVLLLRGSAGLRFEDAPELVTLGPGDYVRIPAHCRHRVEWTDGTEPTVWLALHYRKPPEP